jgi:uncharacterized protein
MNKAEIREYSAALGLPTADKPQMACLSSRIPHGEKVTVEKLAMVEKAENFLRDLGFRDVRVRHHELSSSLQPAPAQIVATPGMEEAGKRLMEGRGSVLARIEVGPSEMGRFLEPSISSRITAALREMGYQHVTLDLKGYHRPGSEPA